jgi:hypothetical protein
MSTTPTVPNGGSVPVYLSFSTFRTAVQGLRAHGLPDTLDRTAWQSRSGAEQGQIISAFKFLKLIDEKGRTQPELKKLKDALENSIEEKQVLKNLLEKGYRKLFELDLATATPGQISDAIGSYGIKGATRDRAVRFFLKAAAYCGIPLSTRLTVGMRDRTTSPTNGSNEDGGNPPVQSNSTPRPRRRRRGGTAGDAVPLPEQSSGSAVKVVALRKIEGTLTLSGTFNPFELDGEERKLVYDIIDLMKKYEQTKEQS